jgi:hypothetical protein
MSKIAWLIVPPLMMGSVAAQVTDTVTQSISFEACLASIQRVAGQHDAPPINIVETSELRMVRFCSADGSVLVTCSRLDQKMVMTKSGKRC